MATVLLTVPSQTYTPRTLTFPVTVDPAITSITIRLTRESWPAGFVASAGVTWSDGGGGGANFTGGTRLDKFGQPVLLDSANITKNKDITNGTVSVVVAQTITTAITIEVQ